MPVDLGFTLAEQIEIGSIQDEDFAHFICIFNAINASIDGIDEF